MLGREPYERREQGQEGYRNGYKSRSLATAEGRVPVQVPQVRGIPGRSQPELWRLLKKRTEMLERLVVEMYVRGLSTRDIEATAVDEEGEPLLSRSSVSRVTEQLWEEYGAFSERDLSGLDVVYLFADAIYESLRQQAGLKGGILVTWALTRPGVPSLVTVSGRSKLGYHFGSPTLFQKAAPTWDLTPPWGWRLAGDMAKLGSSR